MEKFSLRTKLMVCVMVAVLAPLVFVGFFSVYKSSSALEAQALTQSMEVARGLANMANIAVQEEMKIASQTALRDTVIEAAAKYAQGVAEGPEIEKASAELEALVKNGGDTYESIFIAGLDGKLFADGVGGKHKGVNVTERDYFKAAKTGKVNVGSVVKSKTTGAPVLTFGAPVYSKTKEMIGVVGMIENISFMTDKVAGVKMGDTGYGYAINGTGIVVAHPKKEYILDLDLSKNEGMKTFVAKMIAGEAGAETYSFDGVKKVAGFAPVPLARWSVGITQNYGEVMAPARSIRNVITMAGIVFALITVVGVFLLARSIALPIGNIARNLKDASEQVAGASSQVASASQGLAAGASEQASSLEETSSSLEEMSSMTQQNAGNAAQAKSLMAEVNAVVRRIDGHMGEMAAAIQEVTKSSEETGKIVKSIDEIAFQTNLLALNAAVEAARAGEAGAGFAVVADEVRNLAIRAAEAAKNTSTLIENTIGTVRKSNDLTKQTQEAFRENVAIAGKVGNLVAEIAAASEEQAQGIGQITKAVTEMDKVVQQTAANSEESASASEEMNAQAEQMKVYVQELVAVINGSGTAGDLASAPAVAERRAFNGQTARLAAPVRPGSGKAPLRKQKFIPAKTTRKRPEEVIPLEEGGFKDF